MRWSDASDPRRSTDPAWLDDAGDPTLRALAHWRALAVAGSCVRTRDSSLVVRVADLRQAAALHASAEVIGSDLRRENGRRESRHRIIPDAQTVPSFERLILQPWPEPTEAVLTRRRTRQDGLGPEPAVRARFPALIQVLTIQDADRLTRKV